MKPRQKRDYRRAVATFSAFCSTLEEATRRKPGTYVMLGDVPWTDENGWAGG